MLYVMIWPYYLPGYLEFPFPPWATVPATPATSNLAHGARRPHARPKGWGTLQRSMLLLPSHATRPPRNFACERNPEGRIIFM